MKLGEMPHVIQFNKRDLAKLTGIEDLNAALNKYNAPFYESVATTGIGVQDTLKAITKLVLLHLTKKYDPRRPGAGASVQVPAGIPPAADPNATMVLPRPASGAGTTSIPLAAAPRGMGGGSGGGLQQVAAAAQPAPLAASAPSMASAMEFL